MKTEMQVKALYLPQSVVKGFPLNLDDQMQLYVIMKIVN